MKTTCAVLALTVLAISAPADAREVRSVPGSPAAVFLLSPHLEQVRTTSNVEVSAAMVESGQLVLDVIDGKSQAAVVAMTLPEAVAAAREAARQQRRKLAVPAALQFHEVARFERDSRPVGFVTMGAPSAELEEVMVYLRSRQGEHRR